MHFLEAFKVEYIAKQHNVAKEVNLYVEDARLSRQAGAKNFRIIHCQEVIRIEDKNSL